MTQKHVIYKYRGKFQKKSQIELVVVESRKLEPWLERQGQGQWSLLSACVIIGKFKPLASNAAIKTKSNCQINL